MKAQEKERPLIRNFSQSDINASSSNWGVTQDKRGVIFISNFNGILNNIGDDWNLTHINNELIALYMACDSKNRIFVCSHGDFGFLQPDQFGQLIYHSLGKKLPKELQGNIFWKVLTTSHGIYFHSHQLIVRWHEGKLTYWQNTPDNQYRFSFSIRDTIFIIPKNQDIKIITKEGFTEIPQTKWLVNNGLILMAPYNKKSNIYLTNTGDIFINSKNRYQQVDSEAKTIIKPYRLYSIDSDYQSNHYAIGTLTGGIVILDSLFKNVRSFNKSNGLGGDVIKDVNFDTHNNLWCASNNGVSFVEISSPWKLISENNEITGKPEIMKMHKKNVYIGSPEGLFILGKNKPLLNGKIWNLYKLKDQLIIASQNGLYKLENNTISEILDFTEVTAVEIAYQKGKTFMIVGHSNGLSIVQIDKSGFSEIVFFSLPNSTFNTIKYDTFSKSLWVSSKFNGLYNVYAFWTPNNSNIIKYNTNHGLPDINKTNIITKQNQIFFTTSKGFYHFNEQTNRFEPDSSILKERININNIAEDKYGNYIISVLDENRKYHVEMLKKVGDEYIRDYIPFRRLPEMEITAIYPDDDYIWIAGGEGLFRFDRNVKKDYTIPFNTLVSQVSVRDSIIFYGNYYDPSDTTGVPPIILDQPEMFKPQLEFKDNSLTFNFSAAFYEAPERTLFSYYLENNEEGWSKWSTNTTKEYNNLSAGTYTFHVKSKNIYDTEGRVASYEFTILPPWYQTTWAYFIFAILGILFVWIIALIYTYRVRMQRRRLKLIIADRTYEVISQKKEIERQKDLLQVQFEKISIQKNNIEEKNIKLQNAQQETQHANEALHELNLHLEKEVEKRTEKIKSTLHQLQLKNKELDTFIYRASHDLEGPISRISGLSALVKMAFPKDADPQYLDLIEVTAKNMKVLISKLTQVHGLHNAVVKKEPVDLTELLSSIRQSLKHLENDGGVHFTMNIPEDIDLQSDVALLTIILQNLIENALIFRKPRGCEQHITIDAKKIGDKTHITVHDVGTGIQPDHIAKLFDMFFRGTNESLGSGLGLYLAKMAIDRLEANIEVRSELHEYSEFTLIIPQ